MSKLCAWLGHRRDKPKARPFMHSWRSECVRCGVSMVRRAPGRWVPAPQLKGLLDNLSGTPSMKEPRNPFASLSGGSERTGPGDLTFNYRQAPATKANQSFEATPFPADSREHYLARSNESRRMAAVAANSAVELIHLDLATRYELLARQASDTPRLQSVK